MKDSPSVTGLLPDVGENALADAIREAVGAEAGAEVVITTPQFTRLRGTPMPGQPPSTTEEWADYRTLTMLDLVSFGFGNWDGGLALVPGEWHDRLPNGLVLECISGEEVTVGKDYIDDDIRFGCLAYGIRIGPPTDE